MTRGPRLPRISSKTRFRGPLWIRFRKCYQVDLVGVKRDPWIYFYWDRSRRELVLFAKAIVGSFRDEEWMTAERPTNINRSHFDTKFGVDLYMERF